jgi:hypothetical protein
VLCEINLNLTTASSAIFVVIHVFIEFGNSVVVSFSSDIKHQGEFWFKIFANTLKEPLVTVDFSIISLLYGHNEVDPSAIKSFII